MSDTTPLATIDTTDPTGAEKSGPQTTEFWTLIAHYAMAIFISLMAFLHPGYHLSSPAQGLVDAITPSFAILAAAIAHYGYSRSRAQAKTAAANVRGEAIAATAGVHAQQIQSDTNERTAQMQAASSERMASFQATHYPQYPPAGTASGSVGEASSAGPTATEHHRTAKK